MKISMHAEFQIFKNGIPVTVEEINSLSVGSYYFMVEGKEVPFEWEDYIVRERDGIFIVDTGDSSFCRNYELADYYYDEYKRMNLPVEFITAKFLANASAINDFHINYIDTNNEEVDFGDNIEDEEYKIFLHEVYFEDIETYEQYPVKLFVLDNFNTGKVLR